MGLSGPDGCKQRSAWVAMGTWSRHTACSPWLCSPLIALSTEPRSSDKSHQIQPRHNSLLIKQHKVIEMGLIMEVIEPHYVPAMFLQIIQKYLPLDFTPPIHPPEIVKKFSRILKSLRNDGAAGIWEFLVEAK